MFKVHGAVARVPLRVMPPPAPQSQRNLLGCLNLSLRTLRLSGSNCWICWGVVAHTTAPSLKKQTVLLNETSLLSDPVVSESPASYRDGINLFSETTFFRPASDGRPLLTLCCFPRIAPSFWLSKPSFGNALRWAIHFVGNSPTSASALPWYGSGCIHRSRGVDASTDVVCRSPVSVYRPRIAASSPVGVPRIHHSPRKARTGGGPLQSRACDAGETHHRRAPMRP